MFQDIEWKTIIDTIITEGINRINNNINKTNNINNNQDSRNQRKREELIFLKMKL